MKVYEFIDFIQRKINSLLFRFVLISYSTLVLGTSENSFSSWIYVLSAILYFIIYISLHKHSKTRLLNDFIFISIVLYGKDPSNVVNFILLVLPIINSINFSGQKKSFLLYWYTAVFYLTLLSVFSKRFDFDFIYSSLYSLSSLGFLWIINSYTALRIKVRTFREELNSVVDNFYLKKEEIKRPHKIYKSLISVIHDNIKTDLIEEIICFTVVRDVTEKLVIANGSTFIWQFSFSNNDIVEQVRTKRILLNEKLYIEGKKKFYNLILHTRVQEQDYIYVFITKKSIPVYYLVIGFFRTLEPSLTKISRVLLSEKKLQELKSEEISKLSERSQYVNRANKTMHFMRNRLGPFSNLLKMLDNLNNVPSEKQTSFNDLLADEKDRAQIELNNITKRANDMLEKSNNPFVYNSLERLSLERVFTILKRNISSFFPQIEITLNITTNINKRFVQLNEEGFELFLSDWLNNMSKYKNHKVACSFLFEDTNLTIEFLNDHSSSQDDIRQMITDLTSDNRNEIMKRTTHGLYTIKSTLEDMNILFDVFEIESEKAIVLRLKLKTLEDANSNI